MSDEFYVGYLETPPETARRLRRIVAGLIAVAAGIAIALGVATGPFDRSRFEFASVSDWDGTIESEPIPVLIVEDGTRLPLVIPGKHGASAAVGPFDGAKVALRAKRIDRLGTTMLEIDPDSIVRRGKGGPIIAPERRGEGIFEGEIVDSKCFLGVMNPGRLEVHRACAKRCIAGGIPPMLFARDRDGRELHLLLVGKDGESINERILDDVAKPVSIRGRLERRDGLQYLYVEEISRRR